MNLINVADMFYYAQQIPFNLCVQNSELNESAAICTNRESVGRGLLYVLWPLNKCI